MKKYLIYVGLNDRITKNQEVSTIDAFKMLSNFAVKFVGYGTITEARGVYTHDDGTPVIENTLRCEFSGADFESVKKFAEAAKIALNQESVMFEEVQTNYQFI